MSTDDIVFDEVKYREPLKARRPDRDPKLACIAYGLPGASDLPIFLDKKAADKMERHALRDTSVELGGIVLGKECIDETNGAPFVWITEALEAKHYESSEARFKYTHESWEEITRERDRLHPDLDIVGWYHTHPDFGIFLSGLDLFIHENYFNQPLQVAYVVDPIRQTRGFFQWRNGRMESEPIQGFYLVGDRADRIALSRFVNDLEGIANSEGGGGGLSPRLEAQLIAMLSRPQYSPQSSSYDQARASVTQTMFGVILGALALGVVLWINGLYTQIKDQGDRIDKLGGAVKETTDMQRLALDTLIARSEKAGEGSPSVSLIDSYKRTANERDKLKLEAENRDLMINRVADESKKTKAENFELRGKLALADKILKDNETAIKEAKALREDYAKLSETVETQNGTIAVNKEVMKAFGKDNGVGLLQRYYVAWYVALGGWIAAILAGVRLVMLWMRDHPLDDDSQSPPNPNRPIVVPVGNPSLGPGNSPSSGQEPPHLIS